MLCLSLTPWRHQTLHSASLPCCVSLWLLEDIKGFIQHHYHAVSLSDSLKTSKASFSIITMLYLSLTPVTFIFTTAYLSRPLCSLHDSRRILETSFLIFSGVLLHWFLPHSPLQLSWRYTQSSLKHTDSICVCVSKKVPPTKLYMCLQKGCHCASKNAVSLPEQKLSVFPFHFPFNFPFRKFITFSILFSCKKFVSVTLRKLSVFPFYFPFHFNPSALWGDGVLQSSASVCPSVHTFSQQIISSMHRRRKVIYYLTIPLGVA